ncbi:peptidase M14 [Rhodovarius crocodyli]|uniref:Peptidase M14 n=1 Tax=Rhodovarius crocodyli TaxID=1979269 RepID=A0A437MDB6_9PROT|nr:succinylglutamate desuccinylase/aspartoacylase family protein [Rhodovarius crocodyli]RVT95641.1 peptidase M14 [Rhodovarius crocodyli]
MPAELNPALAALAAGEPGPPPPVRIARPDLRPWVEGNVARGAWSFEGPAPGPHICILALTHGNEIAGAVLLERWLRQGLRPVAGRLSLVFANLDAFAHFDPADPVASRFVEQDFNRVWNPDLLDGPGRSSELRRARVLRPLIESADILLDLHSMLWPADPLLLSPDSPRCIELGLSLGEPPLVVADQGHESGRRVVDHLAALGRRAVLLEAGDHWEPETVARMERAASRLLHLHGLLPGAAEPMAPSRLARVTESITARSPSFSFIRPFRGGEVLAEPGTLIATDGSREIRTPHENCLLVMPTLRTAPGVTAVRLARFEEA